MYLFYVYTIPTYLSILYNNVRINTYNIYLGIRYKIIHIDVFHLHVIYMYTHSLPYVSFFHR